MTSDAGFWSVTITDVVQAGGAIAAVGVAIWANNIARAGREVARGAAQSANESTNAALGTRARVQWRIEKGEGRSQWRIVNSGTASAHVVDIENVSDGHRDALGVYDGTVPTDVDPGNAVTVFVDKSLASPAITKVKMTWTEDDGDEVSRVYNIV